MARLGRRAGRRLEGLLRRGRWGSGRRRPRGRRRTTSTRGIAGGERRREKERDRERAHDPGWRAPRRTSPACKGARTRQSRRTPTRRPATRMRRFRASRAAPAAMRSRASPATTTRTAPRATATRGTAIRTRTGSPATTIRTAPRTAAPTAAARAMVPAVPATTTRIAIRITARTVAASRPVGSCALGAPDDAGTPGCLRGPHPPFISPGAGHLVKLATRGSSMPWRSSACREVTVASPTGDGHGRDACEGWRARRRRTLL